MSARRMIATRIVHEVIRRLSAMSNYELDTLLNCQYDPYVAVERHATESKLFDAVERLLEREDI